MNEFFAFSTVADSQGAEPYRPIHILARTIWQVFHFWSPFLHQAVLPDAK